MQRPPVQSLLSGSLGFMEQLLKVHGKMPGVL